MGESLPTIFDETDIQVQSTLQHADAPGLNWCVSDETKKTIEEINASIRAAEKMSGQRVAR
jgi:hypothetical protein